MKKILFFGLAASLCGFASADFMDRPNGIRVGQRLTLRPYVSISYTFDSNVDCTKRSDNSSKIQVNPGIGAEYVGDNWKVNASAFYRYDAYLSGYSKQLNNHNYGQNLGLKWEDGFSTGKGWALSITESFRVIDQDDDAAESGGRGVWRDRKEAQVNGTLQRRFNEHLHAGVLAGYYWLDYDNDDYSYAPLYGWQRWQAAGQLGYIASKWTDFFIQFGYQGYEQDNDSYYGTNPRRIDDESKGYTVQVGFGSFMTERITYRFSGGWSRFEYGDCTTDDGFTYRANLDWKFAKTWRTTLLAASYYQPSERDYGSASRIDYVTWGLAKSLVRDRLQATFDITYRHEKHTYSASSSSDYQYDLVTCRLGFSYNLNRFLQAYARYELQEEFNESDGASASSYDYDRHRFTIGCRLAY